MSTVCKAEALGFKVCSHASKVYYLGTTQETMPFKKKKIEKTGGMRYFNIAMVLEGGRKQGKEEYKSLLT